MNISDSVVVITGASSGIGFAIAKRFSELGCKLSLGYLGNSDNLETLALSHPKGHDFIFFSEFDVSDHEACLNFIFNTEKKFGQIDVLVTSAGIAHWGKTESFSFENFNKLFAINVNGTFSCIQAVLPGMLKRSYGRIITISSEIGLIGMAEATGYSATKGAVISMTKSLAKEYASRGILINSVAPGPTKTPMLDGSPEVSDSSTLSAIPIGRFGEPDEIVGAVVLLAGMDGSFFCGQVLSPNGGAAI